MNLNSTLDKIKGVGEKTYQKFKLAGIETVEDLINFLPRRYEDFSNITRISDLKPGKVTIKARCEKVSNRRVRRGLVITTASLSDDNGKVKAVWFNQAYRFKQLADPKTEFYISGEFGFSYNTYQITNPSVELIKDLPVQTGRILPVYSAIYGLKSNLVRQVIADLRPFINDIEETLPAETIKSQKLFSLTQALTNIHFPDKSSDLEEARRRLAFEELFHLILASQLNKQANTKLYSRPIPFDLKLVKQFLDSLPFKLTDSQRLSAWEIIQDLEKPVPMNRLLQGDVGSGKTVVAGLIAGLASNSGFQTAIMAPTEILARQHFETLDRLLSGFGVKLALLTGSIKGDKRRVILEELKSGQIDLIIGTQALIQNHIAFSKLGLVIIDEQHRFGVKQRQALLQKANLMPHLLAMTATPIPRSLALTVFGELDISTLSQLPGGRLPIITEIISPNSRDAMYEKIKYQLDTGHQAYIICNLIENSIDAEQKSVKAEYDNIKGKFKKYNIGMLHGKMKNQQKTDIMQQFANGDIDILVSTTVVEVGISVPNATVIVIENADQFGLSQLHQLRGRVGRGQFQSYCYLVNSTSLKPTARLKALANSNDGFYLAEMDLNLRGPGEIYGYLQHGRLNLNVADLTDIKLLKQARQQAIWFIQNQLDLLKYPYLAKKVQYYQRLTTLN